MLALVLTDAHDTLPTADVIGPYGALVLALAAIAWLIKDRARIIADRDAERAARETLHDRLLATTERLVPIIEQGTQVIEATTRELERARGTR